MNELDDLVDMAHTIFLRMAVRGGFDSYTGARLHEWLRRYEKLPLREAAQQGVQRTLTSDSVFIHRIKCPHCDGDIDVPETRR